MHPTHSYVLLTTTGTFAVSLWHGLRVGPYRKAAGIRYPLAYAQDGTSEAVKTSTGMFPAWTPTRLTPTQFFVHIATPCPRSYGHTADLPPFADPSSKALEKYLFNCAQRAHANFLESYSIALTALLLGGLVYPRTASVMGAVWSVGRVVYALGYTDSKAENGGGRLRGSLLIYPALLGLMGLTGKVGWDLLTL